MAAATATSPEIIKPQDLFVTPAVQIENVKRGNAARNWGFAEEDFAALPPPPPVPTLPFVAVVLVPYLESVQRTFDELWDVIAHANPGTDRLLFSRTMSDPLHLSLLDGVAHERGLRWETIDLAACWSRERKKLISTVGDVRNPLSSPHAGILAAAAHHTAWLHAMDGNVVPYVHLAGYRTRTKNSRYWDEVLSLSRRTTYIGDKRVHCPNLDVAYASSPDAWYAIPEWVEIVL